MLNKIVKNSRKNRLRLLPVIFLQLFELGVGNSTEKTCKDKQYGDFGPGLSCYGYNEIPTKEEGAIAYVLDLNDKSNILESLPTDGFRLAGFTYLKALYLENCQIREIKSGAFSGCETFVQLNLGSNKIEVVNATVFQDLVNLTVLNLSKNPLRAFHGEFPKLRLSVLKMKDCLISLIEPDLFKKLENLEELDLANNQIVNQSLEAIAPLKLLKKLFLDSNLILNLNPTVFKDLEAIEEISLADNPLENFSIGAEFPKLLDLKHLDFQNCSLSSIPPNLLRNLPNLKNLWLNNNKFKTLDSGLFSNLRNLWTLSLEEGELESLPKNVFHGLEDLRMLLLSDNHLATLDWKQLVFMKNLDSIWLANNPWNCGCSTLSLLNFLHNKTITLVDDIELISLCEYSSHLVWQNRTLLMEKLLRGSSPKRASDGLYCPPGNISLRSYNAIEGADLQKKVNVTLQCQFNGFPPADVHWKKNGEDLDITGTVIKFPESPNLESDIESDYDFRQEVFIEQLDAGDVGEYECSVSNPAGTSFQTTFLDPKILGIDMEKPKIASLSATENNDTEHITLKCVYRGVPRPKVAWTVPNFIHFLNESGHVAVNPNGIWYQTRVIMKGLYQSFNASCHVKNYLGEDEATITIEENDTKLVWILALAALVVVAALMSVIFFIRRKKQDKLLAYEISGFFNGSKSKDSPKYVRLPYDKEKYEIAPSKFKIHEHDPLGSGAFGSVVKGIINKSDNGNEVTMEVAVKMTKNGCDPNEIKGLLSELKLLPYLGNNHPNIVKLMGAYTKKLTSGKLYCFLELCSLGSLQDYLRKLSTNQMEMSLRFQSSEESIELEIRKVANSLKQDLLQWSKEIVTALEFIASKKIVHADIATRNVLLTSNKTAKISDFGLARRLYQHQSYVSKNQVPRPWKWMSPEALRKIEFTEKSDVWAFGVTLWEIWSLGDDPFPGLAFDVNFPTNLEKGFSPGSPRIQQDGICSVMNRCWTVCPETRPTFTEVKDLLQGIVADIDSGPLYSG